MKGTGFLIAAGVLAAGWGYMGYKGWTWIPIGAPAGKSQVRIACVGDSITYGALIPGWYFYNYPHRLQQFSGADYCVHNYGMSDRTGMKTGNHPYVKELRYKRSLHFCPDLVVLMFGTNDSKPQNWRGKEEFKSQYRELVQSYLELPNHPKVLLLQPPAPHHLHGETGDLYTFDIQRTKVLEAGAVIKELAEEFALSTIDMFAFTEGHPEWFLDDGIHPNAVGAEKIAERVWAEIHFFDFSFLKTEGDIP